MKTLYWIDDTHDDGKPPKEPAKKRLEKGLNVRLEVVAVKDRKEFDQLLPKIIGEKTCGVMMDYQLTEVGERGQMAYGNTWAAEVRAAHPSVPVIGISHERERDIPSLRLESFLAFFPRDQLLGPDPPFEDVSALLKGYREAYQKFHGQPNTGVERRMHDLIKPPEPVADLVKTSIPPSIRDRCDAETPHVVGRWLWHEFQGRPGFLFDGLELATYLGLNREGLQKVCSRFRAARYRGAFASDSRPRWWVAEIRGIFEHIIREQVSGPLSSAREKLLKAVKIGKTEFPRLLSCAHGRKHSDEIPDCVAYRDDQREEDDRVQVLFGDTYVDERDANPPFGFEARRVYKPSQLK